MATRSATSPGGLGGGLLVELAGLGRLGLRLQHRALGRQQPGVPGRPAQRRVHQLGGVEHPARRRQRPDPQLGHGRIARGACGQRLQRGHRPGRVAPAQPEPGQRQPQAGLPRVEHQRRLVGLVGRRAVAARRPSSAARRPMRPGPLPGAEPRLGLLGQQGVELLPGRLQVPGRLGQRGQLEPGGQVVGRAGQRLLEPAAGLGDVAAGGGRHARGPAPPGPCWAAPPRAAGRWRWPGPRRPAAGPPGPAGRGRPGWARLGPSPAPPRPGPAPARRRAWPPPGPPAPRPGPPARSRRGWRPAPGPAAAAAAGAAWRRSSDATATACRLAAAVSRSSATSACSAAARAAWSEASSSRPSSSRACAASCAMRALSPEPRSSLWKKSPWRVSSPAEPTPSSSATAPAATATLNQRGLATAGAFPSTSLAAAMRSPKGTPDRRRRPPGRWPAAQLLRRGRERPHGLGELRHRADRLPDAAAVGRDVLVAQQFTLGDHRDDLRGLEGPEDLAGPAAHLEATRTRAAAGRGAARLGEERLQVLGARLDGAGRGGAAAAAPRRAAAAGRPPRARRRDLPPGRAPGAGAAGGGASSVTPKSTSPKPSGSEGTGSGSCGGTGADVGRRRGDHRRREGRVDGGERALGRGEGRVAGGERAVAETAASSRRRVSRRREAPAAVRPPRAERRRDRGARATTATGAARPRGAAGGAAAGAAGRASGGGTTGGVAAGGRAMGGGAAGGGKLAGAGSGTAVEAASPVAVRRTGKEFWHLGQRTLLPPSGMRPSSTW